MSLMAKLNLKSIERVAPLDPVQARRGKLIAALDEQQLVRKGHRQKKPPSRQMGTASRTLFCTRSRLGGARGFTF